MLAFLVLLVSPQFVKTSNIVMKKPSLCGGLLTKGNVMKQILIVEDDIDIGNLIEGLLRGEGYQTARAYSGTEALLLVERNTYELVLLDLMLPGLSGEEILAAIGDKTPVIVVSAKASTEDKVQNLLNGAADYITKPFEGAELLARVRVQLRKIPENQELTFDAVRLDEEKNVAFAGGEALKLTKTEFEILRILLARPKQIFSKAQIASRISESGQEVWESSLEVHISNLRKKIFEKCGKKYIEAVWGIGYRFES